jgi:hypothetical protein
MCSVIDSAVSVLFGTSRAVIDLIVARTRIERSARTSSATSSVPTITVGSGPPRPLASRSTSIEISTSSLSPFAIW